MTNVDSNHAISRPIALTIQVDDLRGREIAELLGEHLTSMAEVTPPESMHALNLDKLRAPNITFWSAWVDNKLAGCGALKELDNARGEVKSMRTGNGFVRQGVASAILEHIIGEAKRRGYKKLSLETGAGAYFKPAHRLYEKFGFQICEPFADYAADPNSVFLSRELGNTQ